MQAHAWQQVRPSSQGRWSVRPGRRRTCLCSAFWKKSGRGKDSSSDSDRDRQEPLPIVIPDVVPPPPRGNQYDRTRQQAAYDTDSGGGIGGRGGGAFSAFSRGGRGWGGGGPFSNIWARLRIMTLYFLWACSMYLILSSGFKVLRWLDDRLQITRTLGFEPGQRLQPKGTDEDSESIIEVGGIISAPTTPLATQQGDALRASDAQSAGSSQHGHSPSQLAQTAKAAALGAEVAVALDAAAPELAVATAAAEIAAAHKMDRETQEHLDALKRYQARKEGQQAGGREERDWSGSTAAAYFMTVATLAFFFVAM